MNRSDAIKTFFAIFTWVLLSATASAQVSVKAPPAEVKTKNFDPKHPPADMPKLEDDEAAVTSSKFSCSVKIEVTITPGDHPVMTISAVDASIGLSVVEWLPEGGSKKIRAHEDGHRQISEITYSKAADVAKKLAEKYLGRTYKLKTTDSKETQPLVQKAADQYTAEYFGAVEAPSQKAQEQYDQITDHGRNGVPEKEAIQRAMH